MYLNSPLKKVIFFWGRGYRAFDFVCHSVFNAFFEPQSVLYQN